MAWHESGKILGRKKIKIKIQENGKIPFLDSLVTRDNNKLKTTIYRKPTHTDRLLDHSSYNQTEHRVSVKPFSGLNSENLPQNPSQAHEVCGLSPAKFLMAVISLQISGMRRKQNFEIVFGFKSDRAVLTFSFSFRGNWTFFLWFLQPSRMNRAHSRMVQKISSSCTN